MLEFTAVEEKEIYKSLAQLDVELDSDPLSAGPKKLNSKIAEARKMLSSTERIFNSLSQRYSEAKRELNQANFELDFKQKNLITSDHEVMRGKSAGERNALALNKLNDVVEKVHHLNSLASSLELLLNVVKMKRTDLRDIESRLGDQIKLCREEISLGGLWGSASYSKAADKGFAARVEETELIAAKICAEETDGEIHLTEIAEIEEDIEVEEDEGIEDILSNFMGGSAETADISEKSANTPNIIEDDDLILAEDDFILIEDEIVVAEETAEVVEEAVEEVVEDSDIVDDISIIESVEKVEVEKEIEKSDNIEDFSEIDDFLESDFDEPENMDQEDDILDMFTE